ncbi:MAG: hypothetical protein ACJ71Z_07065 [Aeromicrobium sp.]
MPGRSEIAWVKPPAVLVAVAAVVACLGVGMTMIGSQSTGISTDEPGHVRRVNSYLGYGLYIRTFERERATAGEIPVGAYVYGPMTSALQHDVNRTMGKETGYEAQFGQEQYAVRHAVVAAMSILGLLAVVAIAWIILGDWGWGVVAGGILAATPLWTGHAMFNPKDVPVASAHTLLTAGLIWLALTQPAAKPWRVLAGGAAVAAGSTLMLGTRPGMWPSLVASLVVFGVILVRTRADQTRRNVLRLVGAVLASAAASYAALVAVYPRVYSDVGAVLRQSVFSSAHYDGYGAQRRSDRFYVPVHLLTDLPVLVLLLTCGGTAVAVVVAVRPRRSIRADCLALVGSQAFALMAAAVLFNSNLYQGLRQLLFAIPALAVLATVGVAALLTKVKPGPWRLAAISVASAALVLPVAAQVAMFPYQYAYMNLAAQAAGHVDQDGPDYFGTSFREYAQTGPQDVKIVCPFLRFGGTVKRNQEDCRTDPGTTLSPFWAEERPVPDRSQHDEYYAILRSNRPTPPNCSPFRQVTRRVNLQEVVMSRMFRCHRTTESEKLVGQAMKRQERARQGWMAGPDATTWVPAAAPQLTPLR